MLPALSLVVTLVVALALGAAAAGCQPADVRCTEMASCAPLHGPACVLDGELAGLDVNDELLDAPRSARASHAVGTCWMGRCKAEMPVSDGPGYVVDAFSPEAYAWVDLSKDSNATELNMGRDDDGVTMALPFAVPVYSAWHGVVTIGSNGLLGFGRFSPTSVPHSPESLPAYRMHGTVLAPYWCDLDLSLAGKVFVRSFGSGLTASWLVQFDRVAQYGAKSLGVETASFQVRLHPSGEIHVQYRKMPSARGGERGEVRKHAIGIQESETGDALTVRISREPLGGSVGLILKPQRIPPPLPWDAAASLFKLVDPASKIFPFESNIFALGDRFHFIERIHLESQLVVYSARERATGALVAIKIAQLDHDPDERPPVGEDVPRDVRVHAVVQGHPRINKLVDWVPLVETGTYALVMEFRNTSEAVTRLELPQIARYMVDALGALAHVHGKGIIYRDFKRDNLFYEPLTGRVTLMDFDCSTFHDPAIGHTSMTGTEGHLAPEMEGINAAYKAAKKVAEEAADAAGGDAGDPPRHGLAKNYGIVGYSWPVDVWAAGVVFGELLFHLEDKGEVPWSEFYSTRSCGLCSIQTR
ncbi:serine/threonine protein kinase [Thecamonas trahens ATCC 50062]|uniref:Serine/threonine protein kinase n=1 Tax=Thecamonas trahens ATCC 50062 TaxID=461836 RepID=A0A0L0DDK6_THETB|nr:serine/threonine protein kinase [Thecamonas trahens ATCC 50062]KNC50399.1 serine/threonine protein kinase [Thecamonas trahens ATCC 50062]|eukprot:XP_013756941.1 serine/threonine protein kinase [Thecamonas trahens ATCC 50062]